MQNFESKKRCTFHVLQDRKQEKKQEYRDLEARNKEQINALKVKMTVVCYI